jgi:glycopeptide antibiotics resistance protein
MKELFEQYFTSLYRVIPESVYEGLLSVFCLAVVACFAIKGLKRGWMLFPKIVLAEYLLLIFCSTVFFRSNVKLQGYNFTPLWSYLAIQQEGKVELIVGNIMNVVAFMPVGFLLGSTFRKKRWGKVVLIGLCISSSIEMLQFVLKKGFSEVDDVMHNILGCMIGYGLYSFVSMWIGGGRRVKCKV